jgi:NAD(P)-dependent dehydrogenase (short-subunit alcohol dehydrogenase family)
MAALNSNMSYDYSGKVVVVTGAAAGIGFSVAEAFAQSGATVALADSSESVVDVASRLGSSHQGCIVDVSNPEAVQSVAKRILERFERVDILVNNAGIGPLAPAEDFPLEAWDRTIAVNLRGAFLVSRAFAANMIARGSGRIINIASQAAVVGIEGHVAYCASKAGIVGMTNCMAIEWGPKGLTVNAISPTVVETELCLSGWAGEKGERARAAIPTRRFAKPWEIAAAVMFVASDGAAMINGANLMIDGGYTVV